MNIVRKHHKPRLNNVHFGNNFELSIGIVPDQRCPRFGVLLWHLEERKKEKEWMRLNDKRIKENDWEDDSDKMNERERKDDEIAFVGYYFLL